jgi:hypothetical protein
MVGPAGGTVKDFLLQVKKRGGGDVETVTCGFCGAVVERATAIAGGWEPFWWRRDSVSGELVTDDTPACPGCSRAHLDVEGVLVSPGAGGDVRPEKAWPPRFSDS